VGGGFGTTHTHTHTHTEAICLRLFSCHGGRNADFTRYWNGEIAACLQSVRSISGNGEPLLSKEEPVPSIQLLFNVFLRVKRQTVDKYMLLFPLRRSRVLIFSVEGRWSYMLPNIATKHAQQTDVLLMLEVKQWDCWREAACRMSPCSTVDSLTLHSLMLCSFVFWGYGSVINKIRFLKTANLEN